MKEKKDREAVYTITGVVVHGRGIGKHVGTPTANLQMEGHDIALETGVYVSKVLLNCHTYYAITHIGTRPTLDNDKNISIETHILDFDNDIYGCAVTVCLYEKLREVRKFDDLSALMEQVRSARLLARKYWGLDQTNCALYMDVKRHCAMLGGQEIYLSVNEFGVLYLLYAFPQTTFTKEEIYQKIWREPANDHLHAVENTIFQIRKKLKPYAKEHEYIKTVIGYGYRFYPAH